MSDKISGRTFVQARTSMNLKLIKNFSAESVVEVIGIGDRFEVVDKKLKSNEPGFIEIEVSHEFLSFYTKGNHLDLCKSPATNLFCQRQSCSTTWRHKRTLCIVVIDQNTSKIGGK
jgi:hypothetical protein